MLHRPKASDSAEAFRNIQSFKRQFGDEHPQVLTSGGDWMYLLKSVDWVEIDKIRFKNGDEWSASDGMICAFPAEQLLCSTGPPKCNHDPVR
jgi:hypothetical protein